MVFWSSISIHFIEIGLKIAELWPFKGQSRQIIGLKSLFFGNRRTSFDIFLQITYSQQFVRTSFHDTHISNCCQHVTWSYLSNAVGPIRNEWYLAVAKLWAKIGLCAYIYGHAFFCHNLVIFAWENIKALTLIFCFDILGGFWPKNGRGRHL